MIMQPTILNNLFVIKYSNLDIKAKMSDYEEEEENLHFYGKPLEALDEGTTLETFLKHEL